jgi:hypothetical protein
MYCQVFLNNWYNRIIIKFPHIMFSTTLSQGWDLTILQRLLQQSNFDQIFNLLNQILI